jgi:hypothetical protein
VDPAQEPSLECHLSAYCAALRIRFYLWRMTKPDPMCSLRTYKRQRKAQQFGLYLRQLALIANVEYDRAQGPPAERFQDIQRELVGEPVTLESVARVLASTASVFCTICQDDHMGSECVSLLTCSCAFGRDCLQPLLNRDTPSSYTCPNCRKQIHKPLKWRLIETDAEAYIGLLRDLRSNIGSLRYEVMRDPEPFTLR